MHQKNKTIQMTTMIAIMLVPLTISLFFASAATVSTVPPNPNMPPYIIANHDAYCNVTFSTPFSSNITTITFIAEHVVQGTFGSNFVLLSVVLFSPLASGAKTCSAIFSNGPSTFFAVQEGMRNGTSTYTAVNGVITQDNLFQVSSSELSLQRNGTNMTVNFNPTSPVAITLPSALFPAASFPATFILPAFQMNLTGSGILTAIPTTTTTAGLSPAWTQLTDTVGYNANVAFNCPTWNYTAQLPGTMAESFIGRFINPSPSPFTYNLPTITDDYFTGASATVTFPQVGNITSMTIAALHIVQSDHMNAINLLNIILTGPLAKGTINPKISTNPSPGPINASTNWFYALNNGTNTYTEVNGNIIINNLFLNSSLNDINVTINGNNVAVDYNPSTPVNVTLDAATFPPGNFSSTWTIPAFHIVFNGTGSLTTSVPINHPQVSGWGLQQYSETVLANATFTVPSWNYSTTVIGAVIPYLVQDTQCPALTASAASNATVSPGSSVTFNVAASGGVPPYTYQWYQGNTALAGQTTPQLQETTTINNANTQTSYYCNVTDSESIANLPANVTVNSNTVALQVGPAPTPTPTAVPTAVPTLAPTATPAHTSSPSPSVSPESPPSPTPTIPEFGKATLVLVASTMAVVVIVAVLFKKRPN